MARTNKHINADELYQLRGTRFLWCQERQNMVPFLVCIQKCHNKCRAFKTYIMIGGYGDD